MPEPPLSVGVVQLRLICEEEAVVAISPIGGDGATRVLAEAVLEGGLVPTALIAETLYVKVVVGVSPVSEYIVVALPVFATSAVQVVPPSVDLSTLYPVMTEPPLSVGAVQLRLICEEDAAVAASPVGGDGATARVVADAMLEGEPVPTELMAETL